ncbi:SH3 domain-containing protein [Roseibium aggregatum]|uniref:SH3 domain-containing protein n=1 Tax=Roseibium aggregatum TaxID=187304 RepID=A0A939EFP5_9HYPH|nr:SH3 domain-containing protein [Roseibium aggregatum]MBN9672034.1 SH3 domain-containing protein [Roseibium aggregatum]
MRSIKRLSLAAATLVLLSLTAFAPTGASAATAVVMTDLNMRAGPGTHYPVVRVLPGSASVVIYGCTAGTTWCDVGFGPDRGWVSASYIQVTYQGQTVVVTPAVAPAVGLAVVTFNRAYWNTYYVGRPWYASWNTYYRAPAGAAAACNGNGCAGVAVRPGRAAVGQCSNGTCTGTVVRRTPWGPVVRQGSISR